MTIMTVYENLLKFSQYFLCKPWLRYFSHRQPLKTECSLCRMKNSISSKRIGFWIKSIVDQTILPNYSHILYLFSNFTCYRSSSDDLCLVSPTLLSVFWPNALGKIEWPEASELCFSREPGPISLPCKPPSKVDCPKDIMSISVFTPDLTGW